MPNNKEDIKKLSLMYKNFLAKVKIAQQEYNRKIEVILKEAQEDKLKDVRKKLKELKY